MTEVPCPKPPPAATHALSEFIVPAAVVNATFREKRPQARPSAIARTRKETREVPFCLPGATCSR